MLYLHAIDKVMHEHQEDLKKDIDGCLITRGNASRWPVLMSEWSAGLFILVCGASTGGKLLLFCIGNRGNRLMVGSRTDQAYSTAFLQALALI